MRIYNKLVDVGAANHHISHLHEHLDRAQTIDLLAIKDMLHILGVAEMQVHILLDFRQVATDHLDQLGRQVLRVESIHTPQNEVVDRRGHLQLLVLHSLYLRVGRVRLTTA